MGRTGRMVTRAGLLVRWRGAVSNHCGHTFWRADYAIGRVCLVALRWRRTTQSQRYGMSANRDECALDNLRRLGGGAFASLARHILLLYDYRTAVWLPALQTNALRCSALWPRGGKAIAKTPIKTQNLPPKGQIFLCVRHINQQGRFFKLERPIIFTCRHSLYQVSSQ